MGIISTIAILAVYAICIGIIFTRYRIYFPVIILIFISLNDVVFVPLSDWLDPALLLVAKAWKEIFVFGIFSYAILKNKSVDTFSISHATLREISIVLILTVCGVLVGLTRSSMGDAIQQWRRYFIPFILALSIASAGLGKRAPEKLLVRTLIVISCVMAIFSIYEFFVFSGDYRKLWYYSFVALAKESIQTDARLLQYQFVRGEQLRASGFFTSAIEYSLFNAFSLTFSTVMFFMSKALRGRLILFFVTLLLLAGQLVANVRIGWVVYVISIVCVMQLHFLKEKSFFKLAIFPVSILLISFALIVTNTTELDASAVGRLVQYASVPSQFRLEGYGLGRISNNGETYKDSWYISVLMVFGGASILYGLMIFEPLRYSVNKLIAGEVIFKDVDEYAFSIVTIAFFFAQLYVFGFHYTTGLSHIYVLLMFIFIVKFKLANKLKK